ncbi:hypothetical protein [Streptomyces sp. NPDC002913]
MPGSHEIRPVDFREDDGIRCLPVFWRHDAPAP